MSEYDFGRSTRKSIGDFDDFDRSFAKKKIRSLCESKEKSRMVVTVGWTDARNDRTSLRIWSQEAIAGYFNRKGGLRREWWSGTTGS